MINRVLMSLIIIFLLTFSTTLNATPVAQPVTYEQAIWVIQWAVAFLAFCKGVDFGQQAVKL